MSSQSNWTFDELDSYMGKQLKTSLSRVQPAEELRHEVLRAAHWAKFVGRDGEQEEVEASEQERPGDYLELHHRLIGRGLFYHAPLGTQAGFMIT